MATFTHPDQTKIIALGGSLKLEVIELTAVSDGDSVSSKLATPIAAFMVPAADAGATTTNPSVTISSKALTLNDPPVTAVTVFVLGT